MKKQLFAIGIIFAIGLKSDRLVGVDLYSGYLADDSDVVIAKTSLRSLRKQLFREPSPQPIGLDEREMLLSRVDRSDDMGLFQPSNTLLQLRFVSFQRYCELLKSLTLHNLRKQGYKKLKS
jgi:hypothetical protein